jgi:hypothetical protein
VKETQNERAGENLIWSGMAVRRAVEAVRGLNVMITFLGEHQC